MTTVSGVTAGAVGARQTRRLLVCAVLMTAVAVVGCANPREDVRLTLCKDLVSVQLGAAPSWQGSEVKTRGREGAVVTVHFATAGGEQQAACYYEYDAVDDTAAILANPIEAYATSPSTMILNGRTIAGSDLARAVGRAMKKQGREFIERARDAIKPQQSGK